MSSISKLESLKQQKRQREKIFAEWKESRNVHPEASLDENKSDENSDSEKLLSFGNINSFITTDDSVLSTDLPRIYHNKFIKYLKQKQRKKEKMFAEWEKRREEVFPEKTVLSRGNSLDSTGTEATISLEDDDSFYWDDDDDIDSISDEVQPEVFTQGAWLSSEENVHSKDKGWSNCWDDEQCRALVKSHIRTFSKLEETLTRESNMKLTRKSFLLAGTERNEFLLSQISEMKDRIANERKESNRLCDLHAEINKSASKLRANIRKNQLMKRVNDFNSVYTKMEEMKYVHDDLQESIEIYTLDRKQMETMSLELKCKIMTLGLYDDANEDSSSSLSSDDNSDMDHEEPTEDAVSFSSSDNDSGKENGRVSPDDITVQISNGFNKPTTRKIKVERIPKIVSQKTLVSPISRRHRKRNPRRSKKRQLYACSA